MPESSEYNKWNTKKQSINYSKDPEIYFKEREIWWCSIGLNIGFEENGKGELFNRPVLILKKYGRRVFVGIPISNTKKEGRFYYKLKFNDQENSLLLTHHKLFDSLRLTQKIGTLDLINFENIRKAVKDLL